MSAPRCFWAGCPNKDNYEGINPNLCTKCRSVQYCGRDCQVGDWREHKKVCGSRPVMIDPKPWKKKFEWLFRWAAYEALGRDNENGTDTWCVCIPVGRTDRIVQGAPLGFAVEHPPMVILHGTVEKETGVNLQYYGPTHREEAAKIRAAGGLGIAVVICVIEGRNGMVVTEIERYKIERPVSKDPPVAGWEQLLTGVINGEISPSVVQDLIARDAGNQP